MCKGVCRVMCRFLRAVGFAFLIATWILVAALAYIQAFDSGFEQGRAFQYQVDKAEVERFFRGQE